MDRRFFLKSAAAVAAGSLAPPSAFAGPAAAPVTLTLDRRIIEVNGKAASVFGILQADGTQGISIDVSQPFRVDVRNNLDRISLIHWHGLTPPYVQDGVPYVSAPPIPAGGSQGYDFKLDFSGTFWMHSHVGLQEQELLSAPLIIHEAGGPAAGAQEIVVMLHDFTFENPEDIFAELKNGRGAPEGGVTPAAMTSGAGMSGTKGAGAKPDLNDVDYDAFLANDRTLADPAVIRVERGGRVRLRLINGSAATNYWISLGGLRGTLIAVDGTATRPVALDALPLAIAQRADILIELPSGAGAYPILAQVEGKADRSGIVLATSGAAIARIPLRAAQDSPPVGFAFERSLAAAEPLVVRAADITREVKLTGDIAAYVWMMDDQVYPKITPIMVAAGKRVEFVMQNKTMMSHPMHLHGHRFQVVGVDGARFEGAVRDTVLVPPLKTVTIAFDTDNPGRWAFHCHNLWHLAAGMMTVVDYEGVPMPLLPADAAG
ncbi:MAG TPA: multicopper oxidase family protein [Acetobacteraceae bacterium]|nr:multicopper oxidase family protein [Acetobacteraceae bacterium]